MSNYKQKVSTPTIIDGAKKSSHYFKKSKRKAHDREVLTKIETTDEVDRKLMTMSASTIDRLLKKEKDKFRLGKGRSGTKPGTLLKNQIPIRTIIARFPFDILGIDSDNGSEFINDIMLRYCSKNEITFIRSRPYKKNDSCFVEQKNYSVARRNVWYLRHDTDEELRTLNELYIYLDSYVNYFQPV